MNPHEPELSGAFVYTVSTRRWWWADSVFRIHGFEPGDVVPSEELVAAHQHPDEAGGPVLQRVLDRAPAAGQPCPVWHRVVDAHRRVRQVLTVAELVRGEDGTVHEVRGCMVDVTDVHRLVTADEVNDAVRRSAETRAAIEQAKGAVMAAMQLSPQQAYQLLKQRSQHSNTKLRDLAQFVVDGLPTGERAHPYQAVSRLLGLGREPEAGASAG